MNYCAEVSILYVSDMRYIYIIVNEWNGRRAYYWGEMLSFEE